MLVRIYGREAVEISNIWRRRWKGMLVLTCILRNVVFHTTCADRLQFGGCAGLGQLRLYGRVRLAAGERLSLDGGGTRKRASVVIDTGAGDHAVFPPMATMRWHCWRELGGLRCRCFMERCRRARWD